LPHGQKLEESVSLTTCLEEARKQSDWDRKRHEFPQRNAGSELKKGIGVAALFHGLSLGAEGADYAGATIRIDDDNGVTLTSGFTDYGQGSRTVFTLIAAEVLGVRPDRIDMLRPDTDTAIESGPTVASRATVLGGNATRIAAANLKRILDLAAADLLGCQAGQLIREGESYIGPDETPVSWDDVVAHARKLGFQLSAQGRWQAPTIHWDHHAGRGEPYFAYHFAAQVAEVTVDMGTGQTRVDDIWAVHDLGRVIFPQGAYGQVYGGIAQGLGYALTERVDFVDGYIQQTNFERYLIPNAADMPRIHITLLEDPLSVGPFGAKNVAEPAMVPTAAAIANAVAHATGRRIRRLPISLEQVLLGYDLTPPGTPKRAQQGLWL
jgi:CO/xanthine dehydrogenase Mo-binding subunit